MDLLETVFAQVLANIVTIIIGAVLYWNFLLFNDYIWTILWAFVISQALRSGKKRLVHLLTLLSEQQQKDKKMIVVACEKLKQYIMEQQDGQSGVSAVIYWLLLDNSMLVFAVVGWFTLLCHLVPWYSLVGAFLGFCIVPTLLFLYIVDRKIFLYRKLISDEMLAASIMVTLFFSSMAFVSIFLGAESVLEGMEALESASRWVHSTLDDDPNQQYWNSILAKGRELMLAGVERLRSTYGTTVWWSIVQMALDKYSELDNTHAFWDLGMQGWIRPLQSLLTDMYNMDGVSEFFAGVFDGKSIMRAVLNVLNFLAVGLGFFFSMGFKALLFFTCLFYMLTDFNVLKTVVEDLLPVPEDEKKKIRRRLQAEIEGAFFIPTKIACFRGLVSLACFNLLNMEFPFFASFLSFLITLFPFVNAWLVSLPWVIGCWAMGCYIRGSVLLAILYSIFSFADTKIYSKSLRHNPYVTSLSYFMGFYVFGMKGVLLGPLTVCMGFFIYSSLGYRERDKKQSFIGKPTMNQNEQKGLIFPSELDSDVEPESPILQKQVDAQEEHAEDLPLGSAGQKRLYKAGSRHADNFRSYSMDDSYVSSKKEGTNYFRESLTYSAAFLQFINKSITSQREAKANAEKANDEKIRFYVRLQSDPHSSPVRFDLLKSAPFEKVIETVKAAFQVEDIEGLYGDDGSKIVSVTYIDAQETLNLVACKNMNTSS